MCVFAQTSHTQVCVLNTKPPLRANAIDPALIQPCLFQWHIWGYKFSEKQNQYADASRTCTTLRLLRGSFQLRSGFLSLPFGVNHCRYRPRPPEHPNTLPDTVWSCSSPSTSKIILKVLESSQRGSGGREKDSSYQPPFCHRDENPQNTRSMVGMPSALNCK